MSQNSPISDSLKKLLQQNIGFHVSVFDMIYIRQLESGQIAIGENLNSKNNNEKIFSNIDEAVNYFEKKRAELKLGLDYE